MKTSTLAILAATLCLGVTAPAFAAFDSIGSVDVDGARGPGRGPGGMRGGIDHDVKRFDLGGPVERLQLRAEHSDIDCRSVNARYSDGRERSIYNGRLRSGRTANIDVPNGRISSLAFNCAATNHRGGTIRITADVGRYRNDWMRGPNWKSSWARMFNWGSDAMNNWRKIGSETFEGRNDSESSFAGLHGQNVTSVALMPLETDAHCNRVIARFDNGREQTLDVNHGDILRRGQYYKLDLPGRSRDLESLHLRCGAVNARRVTIQIFAGR